MFSFFANRLMVWLVVKQQEVMLSSGFVFVFVFVIVFVFPLEEEGGRKKVDKEQSIVSSCIAQC